MEKEQIKNHFAKQADAYEELMVRIIPQYQEQHEIISSVKRDNPIISCQAKKQNE